MKKNYLLLVAVFITASFKTQVKQLRSHVKITAVEGNTQIKKMVKASCTQTIMPGFELKDEYTFKNGIHSYTATANTPVAAASYTVAKEKTIAINMPLTGKANILKDAKDSSIIKINFWLNAEFEIPANTPFRYYTAEMDCNGAPVATTHAVRTLTTDTTCYLVQVTNTLTAKWFTHAETIIHVLDAAGNIQYYLVDKYDRDGDYRLELKNREYVSYRTSSFDLGPIVIPFKFRPNIKFGAATVGQKISNDVNLGLFMAYSRGKYRLRREGDVYKDISRFKWNAGGFVDFGTITLDTNSTSIFAEEPFESKQTAPVFLVSAGVGATVSFLDINAGLFIGWDYAIGDYARRWNYNHKAWIGIGFGYNLSNFWKKK